MSRVNRILFRRSGTWKMFRRLESTRAPGSASSRCGVGGQRLVCWLPLAGGRRSPHGSGRISTVPPAAVMACLGRLRERVGLDVTLRVSSPRPSTFTRPPLWTRPLRVQRAGVDLGARSTASRVSRLTAWYSTRNGLLKPLSFGTRCAAASGRPRSRRDRAAGALALGAAAGGLAALAADAAADALAAAWFEPGAGLRSWIFIMWSSASSTSSTVTGAGPGRSCPGSRGGRAGCWSCRCDRGRGRGACRGAWAWCRWPT